MEKKCTAQHKEIEYLKFGKKVKDQNQQCKAHQCTLADILHSASVVQQIQAGSNN